MDKKHPTLIFILLLALLVTPVYGSVVQDIDWSYRIGENEASIASQTTTPNTDKVYGDNWRAQQVSIVEGKEVTVISLYLNKINSPPNDLTVELQTDSGGDPSGTILGGSLTAVSGAGWYNITLTTPIPIYANADYHIVIYTSDGDDSNYYNVYHTSGDFYGGSGRDLEHSDDAGSSWVDDPANFDLTFRIYARELEDYNGSTTSTCQESGYINQYNFSYSFPSITYNRTLNVTYPKTEELVNISYPVGGVYNMTLSSENYTDIDYNITHDMISIPESSIDSYGDEYQLFTDDYIYVYTLQGLYNENGIFEGSINVTAYMPSETIECEVNGTLILASTSENTIQFSWPLSGGGTRRIYPHSNKETIYFFTPDDDYAAYSFLIKDYTGSIGSGDTFLEALRMVNGTERVVERVLIWDTINSVPLTLTIGKIYILQARLSDNSTYRFGYFTPGSDPTPTLTLSGMAFSDQAHYVGEHISVEATRPNATHIQTAYENLLEDTTTLLVEICYMNGTQLWNDTTLNDDIIFNWYDADNETDYLVNIEAYSEFYGDISYSKALAGEKTDITDPPDLDSVLGSGFRLMLSIFIIYMGFIIFSAYTAVLGVFSGLVITYILNFMNFIPVPIPWTILHALMGLLIMWALSGGNK